MEYAITILIISIITLIVGVKLIVTAKERDNQIELENKILQDKHTLLQTDIKEWEEEIKELEKEWHNKNQKLQEFENANIDRVQQQQKL